MKKLILLSTLVTLSGTALASSEIDMGDPTAIYSSVGTEIATNGDADVSVGIASGSHLGLLETKDGGDKLQLTYANMKEGKGFYAEVGGNSDFRTVSAGYVMTFKLTEQIAFYPVAMIGYANNEVTDDVDATATIGGYTRVNLGNGFQLGFDPFYTAQFANEGTVGAWASDAFVGYQYKVHRMRLGVTNKDDGEVFVNYKVAF